MAQKVFVDSCVFLRFLTQDNKQMYLQCQKFFELVGKGKLRPYTSNIVILEIIFVLTKIYHFSDHQVFEDIKLLLQLRNLTLVEKTNSKKALELFKKYHLKYQDCLIASQIPAKTALATYDKDFAKIAKIKRATPADFF